MHTGTADTVSNTVDSPPRIILDFLPPHSTLSGQQLLPARILQDESVGMYLSVPPFFLDSAVMLKSHAQENTSAEDSSRSGSVRI